MRMVADAALVIATVSAAAPTKVAQSCMTPELPSLGARPSM
jgi:hypothetical protein